MEQGMTNTSHRLRHSAPPSHEAAPKRRARSAAVLTVGLLDALDHVLESELCDDALLAASARAIAANLDCLCVIQRLVEGGSRVVGLAHPDPALTSRLSAALRFATVTSAPHATAIFARRGAVAKAHSGARDAARYGLTQLVGSLRLRTWSFAAVPLTVRGQPLGVLWVVTTRRSRILRPAETESVARAGSVIALALAAASAGGASRETTATRRSIVPER
jgi:hypothetical protein